eukprot:TRINITY_DN12860_c0_g1_i1.p1 TRINITY_DN12860_c0_g1~~TRINITY_DN12860_c0_g1_i1.p1  ORF type:complete len:1162 (-),score=271.11 TRINITY_DN12860_c0_g1_i1:50-3343(-)
MIGISVDVPTKKSLGVRLYPYECRQAGISYGGAMQVKVAVSVLSKDGVLIKTMEVNRNVGRLPIMVSSRLCNLLDYSPQEMIRMGEEANEVGGYFIVNGNEKIVRLLIGQRRNYPMCFTRSNYSKSGPNFSEHAINIRCVRPDQSSQSFTLHYLNNGDCMLRFAIRKQSFFLPVLLVLRALASTTDREIYEKITEGDYTDTFMTDRVEMMLRESKKESYYTKEEALSYIGSHFRAAMYLPSRYSDSQVGMELLRQYICVHLERPRDKFDMFVFMIRKLYTLASGRTVSENADSCATQEVLLAGHLFNVILKEKLQDWLGSIRGLVQRDIRMKKEIDLFDDAYITTTVGRSFDVGKKLDYFLATGNLITNTGLDLRQTSGFTIMAEKLNYMRYIAHFRCIHRGQFFTQMRTTAVRKLLPDSWGFVCPVHTPDGSPCGLLNHLSEYCLISTTSTEITATAEVVEKFTSMGMSPLVAGGVGARAVTPVPVLLDGQVVGYLPPSLLSQFEANFRQLKMDSSYPIIPEHSEIGVIAPGGVQFPVVYIFSGPARFVRPVTHLGTKRTEFIGSFEQPYLSIAVRPKEVGELDTHVEISPTNILSITASLTPYSDNNQSPRNMYQCQMLKQTMGTPCHTWPFRGDNKMYRIQSPQSPIVKCQGHDDYHLDEYLTGTNAVVAVLSYTGYDMEDAMIINKSSFERGFGHGFVYKNEIVDLSVEGVGEGAQYFSNTYKDADGKSARFTDLLEEDGLPPVGSRLSTGDPLYVKWDGATNKHIIVKYKGKEECIIDQITALGLGDTAHIAKDELTLPQKISFKYRINRRPIRGDKFSSRHGQKGVLSQLWPQIDMPFSESGMTPDIIINPHAFPSRMTIGMLIESMAGKAGALHAVRQDSTPWGFDEKNRAVDHYGDQLLQAGYNYWGNEIMYSGITGEEFKADIFLGIVYYQRLRHMVGDKYQVRSTGPRNALTHQPIKGRKKGGGIRFGEMERDSLLSHGTSFLLHDRLMNSSDYHRAFVCLTCGSLLTPTPLTDSQSGVLHHCIYCDGPGNTPKINPSHTVTGITNTSSGSNSSALREVALPYVTRYLATELAAMNIRTSLDIIASK